MTEATALGLSIKPEGFDEANRSLEEFAQKADKAGQASDRLSGRARDASGRFVKVGTDAHKGAEGIADFGSKAGASTGLVHRLAGSLGTLAGGLAAYLSVGALASAADGWSDLQSKVGAAVNDMEAAPQLMKELVDMANATYSPLEQTVSAFSGNIGAFRDLGLGAREAMVYTEGLNHALVITATKGEQAASVQNALAKAMDLGKLSGDGLDTVLANGGRVAQALAKELDTNVSSLRKFSTEGKITSAVIANALIGDIGKLREEAAAMPATMADGMTRLSTNFQAMVGQMDKALGVSGMVAGGIMFLADNLDVVAGVLATVGTVVAAGFVPSLVSGTIAIAAATAGTLGLSGALFTLSGAIAATGIGALAVLVGLAVTAMIKAVRVTGSFGEAMDLLGEVANGVWDYIKNGAQSMAAALGARWQFIKSDFLFMVNGMMMDWARFLQTVNAGDAAAAAMATADSIMVASTAAATAGSDLLGESVALAAAGSESLTSSLAKLQAVATAAGDALGEGSGGGGGGGGGLSKKAKAGKQSVSEYAKVVGDLRKELELLQATQGMGALDKAIYGKQQDAGVSAGSDGGKVIDELMRQAEALRQVEDNAKRGADAISGLFTSLLDGSKSLRQGIADLLIDLAKVQMQKAVLNMGKSGGLLGSAFSWLGSALVPNANGGVYDSAGLSAYSGQVVSSPTIFPFAKGAGLMGEAGPEAILPLRRGNDGKLGVSAGAGGAGAGGGAPIDVNINIGLDPNAGLVIRDVAREEASTATKALNANLSVRVQQVHNNPRQRG